MSRVELVVDAANVVGSRPDGWWRDRPGAAARLVAALGPVAVILEGAARSGVAAGVAAAGVAGASEARPGVVGAGDARAGVAGAGDDTGVAGAGDELSDGTAPMLRVLHAPADGDSAIVAEVKALVASGVAEVTVVTADRALRARVLAAGGNVVGPSWLHTRLP
jgi:hypothetical protein